MRGRDSRVEVGGADVHYFDRGSGEVLLCLHGNPDSAELWLPVIAELSGRYRCIAPDLPGFGASGIPAGFAYGLDDYRDFVDGLLSALGIDAPVSLLVHDFGGICGLAWAIERPGRLRRVFVTNTLFHGDYRWHFWARVWRTPVLGELSMGLMNRWLFRRELRRGSVGLSLAVIDAVYDGVGERTRSAVLKMYRAADPEILAGSDQRWLRVAQSRPVFVLWGERDPYIPVSYAHRFGAREVRILERCGHWVPTERAADLAAFVIQHGG